MSPTPITPPAPPTPVNVPVFDPTGAVRQVPFPSVKDALANGGKLAMRMADPQGNERWVPHELMSQALAAGGKMIENPADHPQINPIANAAYYALKPFNPVTLPPTTDAHGNARVPNVLDQAKYEASAMLHHPVATTKEAMLTPVRGIAQGAQQELDAAARARAEGKPAAAAVRTLYSGIPLVGSQLGQMADQSAKGDVSGAVGTGLGLGLQTATANPEEALAMGKSAVAGTAKAVARGIVKPAAPLLPKLITIEGVEMPVLAGEANPASVAGRLQTSLKSQGIRSGKWQEVAQHQQAATKQVIANVAKNTSDMGDLATTEPRAPGDVTPEPGPAMRTAADAVFDKARPMYQALDASLTTVPETGAVVSQIVKQAQARAAKLGAQFEDTSQAAAQEATFAKTAQDYNLTGAAAAKLRQSMGLPEEPPTTEQPLETVLKTRTELLKMARSSSDPGLRRAIFQEVDAMNASVETALRASKTPGLVENWQNANRLWTKGYALRSVSDALDRAVRGTPVEAQAEGVVPQPPTISGARLVQELNRLNKDGSLSRAFTPAQQTALRSVADLLDRSQKTRIGEAHILPRGYSPHSAVWHTVTDIVRSVGSAPLVKLMTSESGARAFNSLTAARTPEAAALAESSVKAQAGVPAPVADGKITDAHVRQENAFYTQARQELGANAPVSQVLQRAQQLKQQGVQMPAPPPSIVHRAASNAHPLTQTQRASLVAATMSQLKSGEITQAEADRRIQKANGGGGRKLVRMPQAPQEND